MPDSPNDPEAPDTEEHPALGPFVGAVSECLALVDLLRERVNDHLGVSPEGVRWGHVADAERLLDHLRQAAFVAGVRNEPGS